MTRHKTNELIEDVKYAGFIVRSELFESVLNAEDGFIPLAGKFTQKTPYVFRALPEEGSETTFDIMVENVPEKVCLETLKRKVEWLEEIRANGMAKACHEGDDNSLDFFFNIGFTGNTEMTHECRTKKDCPSSAPYCRNGICTKCEEGFPRQDGSCAPCPVLNNNTYAPNIPTAYCHICGQNYLYTYGHCFDCQSNHSNLQYAPKSECIRCPNRCWDEEAQKCRRSEEGNAFVNSNGTCNYSCKIGYFYTPISGKNICTMCPTLTEAIYAGTDASTYCHTCPNVLFSSAHCSGCNSNNNHTKSASLEECKRCKNRYYTGLSCLLCPADKHATSDGLGCE